MKLKDMTKTKVGSGLTNGPCVSGFWHFGPLLGFVLIFLASLIGYWTYCTSALERQPGSRSMSTAANSLSSLNPMWPFSFWPKSNNSSSAFWEKLILNILRQFVRTLLQMELRRMHHWIGNFFLIILAPIQVKFCFFNQVLQKKPNYAN